MIAKYTAETLANLIDGAHTLIIISPALRVSLFKTEACVDLNGDVFVRCGARGTWMSLKHDQVADAKIENLYGAGLMLIITCKQQEARHDQRP